MRPVLPRPASRFEPGRNCCAVARAQRLALLVDGEAYFRAFAQAAERATRSIVIIAWDFNSHACLHFDSKETAGRAPARLGDFLNWLVRRRRGLEIFVLDWDYPMVFGTDREFPPLYGIGWKPHRRVHVHYDDTHPVAGSHHQKIVVIDGVMAFVGGFDLTARRWDTPSHGAAESGRIHGETAYPPFHDLMVAVDGEAARVLAELARGRWRAATQQLLAPAVGAGDPWPEALVPDLTGVEVAIARTLPPGPGQAAVREVEELYLDMIAAARERIYIENQYFTAYRLGEALAERLAAPGGPEIVLVSRLLSHGWLEEHTMHILRARLIRQLQAADREGRFHVYYPHIEGLAEGCCLDIHSKLMIVDDEMLRIGSANLCNRSMGMDSECDLVLEARGDPRIAAVIGDFRNRLLGEHLERAPAEVGKAASGTRLHAAIESLRGPGRSLRPLPEVPEWSEAVLELAQVADPERPVSLEELVEAFRPEADAPRSVSLRRRGLLLVAMIMGMLALAALWRYTPLAHFLSPERVIAWARILAGHPWAPLMIVAAYTPATVLMFPRPLITFAAVIAFGVFPGLAYALAGGLLAAFLSYRAGRHLPRDWVRRLAGEHLNSVTEALRRRGLLAVTALRLVPIMPFAALGLVAGALHVNLWHFMLGTAFGLLPGTLAATVFGKEFEAALRDPASISYGLIVGVLVFLVFLSLAVRKWFLRQNWAVPERRPATLNEVGHGG